MTYKIAAIVTLMFATAGYSSDQDNFAAQVRAIIRAQRNSEIAESRLEAARGRAMSGSWSYLPTVSAGVSRKRTTGSGPENWAIDTRETTLDASLNLFKFGADVASHRAATESVRAAELGMRSDALSSETAAANILGDAISARQQIFVYQRRMSAARQSVMAAEARYKKGMMSEQELAKLKLEASGLEMAFKSAQRRYQSFAELFRAWGLSIDEHASWPLAADPETFIRAKQWLADVKPGNLKIKLLEAENAAAQSAVTVARSSLLPSLDLNAGWSKSGNVESDQVTDRKILMLTLTVPLFSRFSDYGDYKNKVHQAAGSSASLEAARLVGDARFQSALRAALDGLDEAKDRQGYIATAERLYDDNFKRFERGLISVNELSIDEHRLRQTEIDAIAAWAKAHEALFKVAEDVGESVLGPAVFRN